MTEAYEEAKLKGTSIYRIDALFDVALKTLGGIISIKELARARTHVDKSHSLNTSGSYTREGFIYTKDAEPIIRRESFLLDSDLARKAVEANRSRKYFSTENRELYDKARAEAKKDRTKEPSKRKAIILPSRSSFQISTEENPETFEFLFGNTGKTYLDYLGRTSLTVCPIDVSTVNSQNGTLLTQAWLDRVDGGSDIDGYSRGLNFNDVVRRVRAARRRSLRRRRCAKNFFER